MAQRELCDMLKVPHGDNTDMLLKICDAEVQEQ